MANIDILTALDIGTTKIMALIAEIDEEDSIPRLIGFGEVPSDGLRRGVVVDLEKTVKAISKAISAAEKKEERKIKTPIIIVIIIQIMYILSFISSDKSF